VRLLKSMLVGLMMTSGAVSCFAMMGGGWQQHRNDAPSSNGRPDSQFHLNGPGPHRGDWLRKYGDLPAQQQEQQLRQDPRFRNLAPEQQQHLLDTLRSFDNLPPDRKATVLNRMETFEHLTPQQQQQARGLFQQYRALPQDRRSKVSQAYHELQGLPPDQRSQLLNSEQYRNSFSDNERALLKGMTDLTPQTR
jgi:Protein of unknown function (DUF3106)